MNRLVKPSRLFFYFFLVAVLVGICVTSLYKLQIVQGAAYYLQSQNERTSTETVAAARGNMLDRYGRTLVSNRECYNIGIDTDRLFAKEVEDPNALILDMVRTIEASGDRYIDELPITKAPPFEYTTMSDIQRTMLDAYFARQGLDKNSTAVELMSFFRRRYDIDNNYSAEEMRIIASIRYSLNVRYAINTSSYVFVEDASVDLISNLMGTVGNIVEIRTSFVREYNTQAAAHLLGYIGPLDETEYAIYRPGRENSGYGYDTQVGKDGIEYTFESWLHGVDGESVVTRNSSGTVLSKIYTKEPEPGNHVYLTIDIQLQEMVERALETGIQAIQMKHDTANAAAIRDGKLDEIRERIDGGAAVVVDVNTGEPLAIASYPTYNLATVKEDFGELLADEDASLFNRALMGTFAPGSTFKPATAIAALSEGIINTETRIDCQGVYTKYQAQGYAPECWIYTSTDHMITHGNDNVAAAIRDSCNYFFYSVADTLGITALEKYARLFGLGEPTGIELPEETGNMANPETHLNYDVDGWVYGDTLQAGIGQSDSLFTPLQLAEYCAALANGGTRHSASILKSIRSYDYSEKLFERESEVLSVVDSAVYNFDAVRLGMHLMTTDINGSSADVYWAFNNYSYAGRSIPVATKTGTAQRGEGRTNNGIFICFAPYDKPEIAVAIVVEKAQAGANLTNIAKSILDAYFYVTDREDALERENTLLK